MMMSTNNINYLTKAMIRSEILHEYIDGHKIRELKLEGTKKVKKSADWT